MPAQLLTAAAASNTLMLTSGDAMMSVDAPYSLMGAGHQSDGAQLTYKLPTDEMLSLQARAESTPGGRQLAKSTAEVTSP